MGFLTVFYKYIIQQYFTVATANILPSRNNFFLTIFYKYIIKSHKRRFISVQLGNGEGVWGGDGDALFSVVLNISRSRKPPPGASINSHKWRSSLFLSNLEMGRGCWGTSIFKTNKIPNAGSCRF